MLSGFELYPRWLPLTVQVTGLQLRDPAPFNDLLLGLADILYFLTPIFA